MGADEADGERGRTGRRGLPRPPSNEPTSAREGRSTRPRRVPGASKAPRVDRSAGATHGKGEANAARGLRTGARSSADEPRRIPPGALRIVLITAPDLDVARALARELVGRRVLACVNVIPAIESLYRWRGAIEEAREVLLVAKTTAARVPELERLLAELHPYEVPECIAFEPASVASSYAAWIVAETAPADDGR